MLLSLIFSHIQDIWPFSSLKLDDLKVSKKLVRRLQIPDETKQFVFAIHEPESQAIVYILAVQNLSQQSAADAECLINEVQPEAVVVQVPASAMVEILAEENKPRDDLVKSMPTTSFGVLKSCIVDKINKEMYENMAGNLVLQEIFGISFHGHVLAAKKAAEEVGSPFFLIESPLVDAEENPSNEYNMLNKFQAQAFLGCSLVPQKVDAVAPRRFLLTNDLQSQMVKSSSSYLTRSASESVPVLGRKIGEFQAICNYQAPPFAQSIYPLFTDLHDIFVDLPSIGRALACAQKMLLDVDKGETVDAQLLSDVRTFQIAVEGLRLALNNSARCPISEMQAPNTTGIEFSELPMDDKSNVLLAQALRSQTKNFKSIVAIVEARNLAGLRKHWKTSVSWEVEDYIKKIFTKYETNEESLATGSMDFLKKFTDKPMVAVGAGAAAVLGASSIPKVVPVSSFLKLVALKMPVSAKVLLTYTQKAMTLTLGRTFSPSRLVAHGIASYGAKTSSVLKGSASAQKVRAVAHCVIAYAQRNSFSITQTAFYEIMRKRKVQPVRCLPWTAFGCSVAVCTGLFMYGDGIECAAESLPAAPSIACLGRGIQSLHQASQEVTKRIAQRKLYKT
ncbi:uncharacterized protein LOC131150924 [Malania oleifera]|uniref:uncharacterized protein LOC131150924 n=1 Tax=Malania oleifera TaxID=397392 RepID=UPI0025AE2597|nr:uncharacterized protein LOC131150924 [Malania oleifera]XP_057957985.1 uncharacterized protein LOC131150924 [Malania oleifera]XP_057957986.1 uncharacterized protein LOC131150924 [Malania oleifera]XP_057957987.1 uncharacterized protein LOC131150924 [Malania oleifera]